MDQIILVDKPKGITSFGVVARLRRTLTKQLGHKIKVGHTGTLDPFATGLLILLTGKNTKKSNDFLKKDKWYEATLQLGATSTTGDPEGEITPQNHVLAPTKTQIETALAKFTGEISQKVPAFSAVKINGQRAYKLARQGKTVATPTRQVQIYQIDLIEYDCPKLKIRTHVSSGTYIRALAENIGQALGTGAYLTALRRTQIGEYSIASVKPLEQILENLESNSCQPHNTML